MSAVLRRRELLAGLVTLVAAPACTREERCQACGMKIDRASAWRTELLGDGGVVVAVFDTPRCAFTAWRSGKVAARDLRVPDYYDRTARTAGDLRFVVGGDVVGPMGPDLVPVDPSRATKFMQDHGAERVLTADEVTRDFLAQMR